MTDLLNRLMYRMFLKFVRMFYYVTNKVFADNLLDY
jgi:hypothetical protein